MKKALIHYQSPASDPHKVPRPHHVLLDSPHQRGGIPVQHGEVGRGLILIGIHPEQDDPSAGAGFTDAMDIDWEHGEKYVGWLAAFTPEYTFKPFSMDVGIERLEVVTEQEPDVATPQADRLTERQDEYNSIAEFLEFILNRNIHLAEPVDGYRDLQPIGKSPQDLIYEFLDIDAQALEQERRALLERIRSQR